MGLNCTLLRKYHAEHEKYHVHILFVQITDQNAKRKRIATTFRPSFSTLCDRLNTNHSTKRERNAIGIIVYDEGARDTSV